MCLFVLTISRCSLFTLVLYEKLSISISKRVHHGGKRLLCTVVISIGSRSHVLVFNVGELRAGTCSEVSGYLAGREQSVHFALPGGC